MSTIAQETKMQTTTATAAARFFSLAGTAARHGGFWVSAAGGTANVVAGEIAGATGVSFEAAHQALDAIGRELYPDGWYRALAEAQPWRWDNPPEDMGRWDARTIARAACRLPVLERPKVTT